MDQRTNWALDVGASASEPSTTSLISTKSTTEETSLAADPRWQLAQRVATSKSFAKSALLSKFLLYVCNRSLSGKPDEISENRIGVHVFVRKQGYNPAEDNIVRNYARQLRQRLDHFFDEEGRAEELRITIPVGKYIPVFLQNRPTSQIIAPSAPTLQETQHNHSSVANISDAIPKDSSSNNRRISIRLLLTLVPILLSGAAIWRTLRPVYSFSTDPSRPLWSQMFDKERQTLLVPSDDGIVMFQNLTGHTVHLAEYISRDYLSIKNPTRIDAQNLADLHAQRYTNITDLDAVFRFSRLPEANRSNLVVRYARELRMEDLQDSNVILLGSTYSNPWVELFQKNLNFEFDYEPRPNISFIANKHPASGELNVYTNDASAPSHRTYAVIALVPNLNNSGWILIVEGLTMAGTQAATDILFNRQEMRSVLEKISTDDGKIESFELLIETRSFGSSSPQARIIATRVYLHPPTL